MFVYIECRNVANGSLAGAYQWCAVVPLPLPVRPRPAMPHLSCIHRNNRPKSRNRSGEMVYTLGCFCDIYMVA